MVEAVHSGNNNLMDNPQQQFQQKNRKKKQDQEIDMFQTVEEMRANKEKKFKEQLALTRKIQSLEKVGNKAAEYLKIGIDRNFHMVNLIIPDDIIVRPRPEHEVNILA